MAARWRYRSPATTARKLPRRLITDLGCNSLEAGDLRQARHMEATAIVIIRLLFGGPGKPLTVHMPK